MTKVIWSFYDETTSAVLLNGSVGEFLQTTTKYDKDAHYLQYYLIYSGEKITQKTFIRQHPMENDCFADAEEVDTPLLVDDRFATCSLLTTLIYWKALKNNSLKD